MRVQSDSTRMMMAHVYPFLRFHFFRLYRAGPAAFLAILISGLALVLATIVYAVARDGVAEAEASLQLTRQKIVAPSTKPGRFVEPVLPPFDSLRLVSALNQIADSAKLPIDEVSYAFDEAGNLPYLRYRVKLTVSANYRVVRQFVDLLRRDITNASLDAISCTRSDIRSAALSCDIALSAFYRKEVRG